MFNVFLLLLVLCICFLQPLFKLLSLLLLPPLFLLWCRVFVAFAVAFASDFVAAFASDFCRFADGVAFAAALFVASFVASFAASVACH